MKTCELDAMGFCPPSAALLIPVKKVAIFGFNADLLSMSCHVDVIKVDGISVDGRRKT